MHTQPVLPFPLLIAVMICGGLFALWFGRRAWIWLRIRLMLWHVAYWEWRSKRRIMSRVEIQVVDMVKDIDGKLKDWHGMTPIQRRNMIKTVIEHGSEKPTPLEVETLLGMLEKKDETFLLDQGTALKTILRYDKISASALASGKTTPPAGSHTSQSGGN